MKTIPVFLEEFGDALKLTGRRRRRVLAEAYDHLVEAKERGIKAGLEPEAAEAAAVEAFGEPVYLASRFGADFKTGTVGRVSSALDAIDCWRSEHPVLGETLILAPFAVVLATLWSPVIAFGCVPIWVGDVWLGRQLALRHEPGYRRRLWVWKKEHPYRYDAVIGPGSLLASGWAVAITELAPTTRRGSWVLLPALLPVFVLSWILNYAKPYRPLDSSA